MSPSIRALVLRRLADGESESDSSPNKRPRIEKPKWSSMHSDPLLDVVLKSSDNFLFRASSHALKRESTLFAGMLSSIPPNRMTEKDAIPLDFPSSSITFFLDSYMATIPPDFTRISFSHLHKCRKLITCLDSDRLARNIERAYAARCRQEPENWLVAASVDNDLPSAVEALCCFREAGVSLDLGMPVVDRLGSLLRPEWRHAFLRCCLPVGRAGDAMALMCPDAERAEDFRRIVTRDAADAKKWAK